MKFELTPHVKSILCGRGMCKNGELLCAATNCLFHPKDSPDPDFGRDIKIKGFVICSRCKTKNLFPDDAEWNDRKQKLVMKCKACRRTISLKHVVWTQEVISRHRRSSHLYYHKECWDAMFFDVDEAHYYGFLDDDGELVRLIKWALRAEK